MKGLDGAPGLVANVTYGNHVWQGYMCLGEEGLETAHGEGGG